MRRLLRELGVLLVAAACIIGMDWWHARKAGESWPRKEVSGVFENSIRITPKPASEESEQAPIDAENLENSRGGIGVIRGGTKETDLREDYDRKFAIVVGVNAYNDPEAGLDDLHYAVNDAREFREILISDFGYKEDDVHYLIAERDGQESGGKAKSDGLATFENVRAAFTDWLKQKKPGERDAVIVFFAGHGWYGQRDERGFIGLTDSQMARQEETAIDVAWVKDQLSGPILPKQTHKLVILDCCYSGALFKSRSAFEEGQLGSGQVPRNKSTKIDQVTVGVNPAASVANESRSPTGETTAERSFSEYLNEPAFVGISAGRFRQVADGKAIDGHSPFTLALLKTLRERANTIHQDHAFTFRQLAAQVEGQVAFEAGSIQVPDWGRLAAGTGDFVFNPASGMRRKTPREQSRWDRSVADCRRAMELLEGGYRNHAIAYLARAVRLEPTNNAAGRIVLNVLADGSNWVDFLEPDSPLVPAGHQVYEIGETHQFLSELIQSVPEEALFQGKRLDTWEEAPDPIKQSVERSIRFLNYVGYTYHPNLAAQGSEFVAVGVCIPDWYGGYGYLLIEEKESKFDPVALIANMKLQEAISHLEFSPNGKVLAFVSGELATDSIQVRNTNPRLELYRFDDPVLAGSTTEVKKVLQVDLSQHAHFEGFYENGGIKVGNRSYQPIGNTLVVSSFTSQELPQVWEDQVDGGPVEEFPDLGEPNQVILSHSKKLRIELYYGAARSEVRVIDTMTEQEVIPSIEHFAPEVFAYFSPNERLLLVYNGEHAEGTTFGLKIYDLATGFDLGIPDVFGGTAIEWNQQDNQLFVAHGYDGLHTQLVVDLLGDWSDTPDYIADLAEALAGYRLALDDDAPVVVDTEERARLMKAVRSELEGGQQSDGWKISVEWLLDEKAHPSPYFRSKG